MQSKLIGFSLWKVVFLTKANIVNYFEDKWKSRVDFGISPSVSSSSNTGALLSRLFNWFYHFSSLSFLQLPFSIEHAGLKMKFVNVWTYLQVTMINHTKWKKSHIWSDAK